MRILIFLFAFVSVWSLNAVSQIYVAVDGSDYNEGTIDKPLATVAMALRKAREMRRMYPETRVQEARINPIEIKVGDGVYTFTESLFVRPEDSGTEESPTIIKAAAGARPIFSGGVQISGWKKLQSVVAGLPVSAQGKVWVANMPTADFHIIRQMWVNDQKATRARDRNGDSMSRILSWDKVSQTCWISKPKTASITNVKGMEMFIHQWWAIAILRIKSVKLAGDSMQLQFHQPESRIQSEHPWPAPWISKKTGNSAFYLMNAIQFLDEPGEWYLDESTRKIYYYPRSNENMSTAKVVAPFLETLIRIEGTVDRPVSYINFEGISFQHCGFARPSLAGHVPLQAGQFLLDAYKLKIPGTPEKKSLENQAWIGRPVAAVEVSYASHTGFEFCRFEHLASTGLDYKRGSSNNVVHGNLFKDIGGSGILVGTFSDEAFETHLPFIPSDERELCSNTNIANNLITDVTNEDWGCVGIGAGYVKGINIEHNEVHEVSYTGISLGWGWTKNKNAMRDNRVVGNKITHYAKHMYDVAGIYTLSAQPGTLIANNSIDSIYNAPYAHDPDHWFYLYTDEGSSFITVRDNWCPSQKFLQNANGPGNYWMNNGPGVDVAIKRRAGLLPAYQYLVKERITDTNWPINSSSVKIEETPVNSLASVNNPIIVEVVNLEDQTIDDAQLSQIFQRYGGTVRVYKWNNHCVAFGTLKDTAGLKSRIRSQFPGVGIKIYTDMFYVFDRGVCSDKTISKDWDNIVLTANLVNNETLQKEYLDYHFTQYEKWPEVYKGFCKADFQQLLLYRNGRQLMLVISIPKGASLDQLNPKTTENNPRVDEWNTIMRKYQEGIPGTNPGEVWVFLQPLIQ